MFICSTIEQALATYGVFVLRLRRANLIKSGFTQHNGLLQRTDLTHKSKRERKAEFNAVAIINLTKLASSSFIPREILLKEQEVKGGWIRAGDKFRLFPSFVSMQHAIFL